MIDNNKDNNKYYKQYHTYIHSKRKAYRLLRDTPLVFLFGSECYHGILICGALRRSETRDEGQNYA